MDLTLAWTMSLRVQIGPGTVLGPTLSGTTTVIPIVGGEVEGPGWKGKVLPGGADWNTALRDNLIEFSARYQFVTDEGVLISVFNEGITGADFSRSVIKTRTTFLVDAGSPHSALLYGIHVGTLEIDEIAQGVVKIGIYRLP